MNCPPVTDSTNVVVKTPRIDEGAISEMYIGAVAEARPTPRPTTARPTTSVGTSWAIAITAAPTAKMAAATRVTGLRPNHEFSFPALIAPTIAAATVEDTIIELPETER